MPTPASPLMSTMPGSTGGGALERRGQGRSLGDTADEDRTRNATGHGPDHAPGRALGQRRHPFVGARAERVRRPPSADAPAQDRGQASQSGSTGSGSADRRARQLVRTPRAAHPRRPQPSSRWLSVIARYVPRGCIVVLQASLSRDRDARRLETTGPAAIGRSLTEDAHRPHFWRQAADASASMGLPPDLATAVNNLLVPPPSRSSRTSRPRARSRRCLWRRTRDPGRSAAGGDRRARADPRRLGDRVAVRAGRRTPLIECACSRSSNGIGQP